MYFFQGKRHDGATGLDDSRGRPYSPTMMRPTQADPLGLVPDVDPYRWEGNNPTNVTDPSGLMPPESDLPPYAPDEWKRRMPRPRPKHTDPWDPRTPIDPRFILPPPITSGPTQVTPPVSADGSEGFFLLVKGGSVISCDLKSVTFSGDAPRGSKAGLAAIRIFTTDKDLIQGYFDEKNHVFDRSLVPPNVVVDEGLRESFQNDTLTLTLKDQRIYPQEGAPWYVTVSGTITFRCDKASIAPGKKAP